MKNFLFFVFVFVLYTAYSLLYTSPVFAHAIGQPPYFRVNGIFTDYYPVPSTSLNDFDLPQDSTKDTFVINKLIEFEIDTKALPIPAEVVDKTKFLWDFGDGKKFEGLKTKHAYTKQGTYFLKIKVDSGDGFEPQLLQSTALNVLPNQNYKLPKAVIEINDTQAKDPLVDILSVDFKKNISFDGSKSDPGSSEIIEYTWDLGDQNSKKGKSFSYTYKENPYAVFPLLRIKTQDGFIADSFVQLSEKDNPINSGLLNKPNQFDWKFILFICLSLVTAIIVTTRFLKRITSKRK